MRNTVLSLILASCCSLSACGEVVEMENGERLIGKVVSLDAKQLRLNSQSFGMMTIERGKVAAIWLQGTPPAAQPSTDASREGGSGVGTTPSVDGLLQQLQPGVGGEDRVQLPEQLALLQLPEVKEYVADKIGGLLSGRLTIEDIRKEATAARDQLNDLKAALGPQATASLDGYLSVLDRFLEKSAGKTVPDTSLSKPGIE